MIMSMPDEGPSFEEREHFQILFSALEDALGTYSRTLQPLRFFRGKWALQVSVPYLEVSGLENHLSGENGLPGYEVSIIHRLWSEKGNSFSNGPEEISDFYPTVWHYYLNSLFDIVGEDVEASLRIKPEFP